MLYNQGPLSQYYGGVCLIYYMGRKGGVYQDLKKKYVIYEVMNGPWRQIDEIEPVNRIFVNTFHRLEQTLQNRMSYKISLFSTESEMVDSKVISESWKVWY